MELKQRLCKNLEGWDGEGDGRFKRDGTYVYLWLIHVDIWQRTTKFCKAVILRLKNKLIFKKERPKAPGSKCHSQGSNTGLTDSRSYTYCCQIPGILAGLTTPAGRCRQGALQEAKEGTASA